MPESPASPSAADLLRVVTAQDAEIADLKRQLEHWRNRAVVGWSEAASEPSQATYVASLEREIAAIRQTLSWRITAPLRSAKGLRSPLRRFARTVRGR